VALRLVGTAGDALSRNLLHLQACDGGVAVPDGRTLLETADGRSTGIDVDLLTLASAAGGGPGVDTVADPPGPGPTPPRTITHRDGRITYTAKVSKADEPYWVVLGQSLSPGWSATAKGAKASVDLGRPRLVNGYANGWKVDPATVGADATITLTWTPQRMVWVALAASLVGALICLLLVMRPMRWLAGEPLPEDAIGTVEVTGIGPFSVDGRATRPARAALVALLVGLVAVLFLGPWVGLAVFVVTFLALAVGRGQVLLRTACVGAFGLAAAFIVVKQTRGHFVVDFEWMNGFEITHAWALFATGLLAVDPLVELLRRRRDSTHEEL